MVSLLLPLVPQAFVTLYGAQTAGIANPVNPMLSAAQLAEILHAAGAKVLPVAYVQLKAGARFDSTDLIGYLKQPRGHPSLRRNSSAVMMGRLKSAASASRSLSPVTSRSALPASASSTNI